MAEGEVITVQESLRREFTEFEFDKRTAKRIEAAINAWAKEEKKKVKAFKKSNIPDPGEKFCLRLPLSGARLKFIGEDGHWELPKSGTLDTTNDEFNGFPIELHCIDQFRNNEDHEASFTNMEVIIFLRILNLTQKFGEVLNEGDLFDSKGKSHYLFVEKRFWGLILAIETLHMPIILKSLREFVRFHSDVVSRLMDPIIRSAGTMKQSAENQFDTIEKAITGFLFFTSPLESIEADADFKGNHGIDFAEVYKYIEQLYSVFSRNHIGTKLFRISTDDKLFDMFAEFSFDPEGMAKGGKEYDLLNREISESIKKHTCLRLRKPSKHLERTAHSVFSEVPSLEEQLRNKLSFEYLDNFNLEVDRYNHILDGIPQEAKGAVMEDVSIMNGYVTFLEAETIVGGANYADILEVLKRPPIHWTKRLDQYRAQYQLDATWSDRILNFERILGIQRLNEAMKGHVSIGALEQRLRTVIETAERYDVDYKRQIRLSDHQSKIDKLTAGGDFVQELRAAKNNLKRRSMDRLRGIEKAQPDQVEDRLKEFIREVAAELEHFGEVIESSDAMSTPSEGVGCLFIGLGQGGQQILRACMANLLNTTSDSRSRNMLHGLGMNSGDIDEIEKIRNEVKNFADPDERSKEKLEKLFGTKANLLAVNLGPELEQLLAQPYSFIWGKPGDSAYKQYNDELTRRPAPNLMLLDPDSQGAGGRMGKGRAFAFTSRDAIRKAIELYKGKGRNITQIAVIHSFAGGSGSGMILPLLGECKLAYPSADIWVLSAGDEKNASGAYTAHNVTYITSEVLQSHYNALHHRAEKLTTGDWKLFANGGLRMLRELNDLWGRISQCLEPNEQAQNEISVAKQAFNKAVSEPVLKGNSGFSQMTGDIGTNTDVFSALPSTTSDAENYHDGLMDVNSDNFFNIWEHWFKCASDPANQWGQRMMSSDSDRDRAEGVRSSLRYKLSYGELRTLANLLKKRQIYDDEDDFNEALEDEEYKAVTKGIKNACKRATLGRQSEEDEIDSFEDLADLITQYAVKMQEYQYEIYNKSERILMNRGVLDDERIKQVIISNAHLDMGVNFYSGNEPTYEIYNSTMAEVFINVVHAMVSDVEGSLSDSGGTHEVMDPSDVRRRTKPPLTAIMIDPIATSELSSVVRYADSHLRDYESVCPYLIFESFFTRRSSPLYSSDEAGRLGLGGESLKALFTVYFGGNKSAMFTIDPRDVIDCYRQTKDDPIWLPYANDEAEATTFFEAIKSEGIIDLEELQKDFDFGNSQVINMLRWIRLIPVNIISGFLQAEYEGALGEFDKLTSEWNNAQHQILNYSGQSALLKRSTREADFINLIGDVFGLEVQGGYRQELTKLLLHLGLLDVSHLSAVQSGFLFEHAPFILTPEVLKFQGKDVTRSQMIKFLATPSPYHRAGWKKFQRLADKNTEGKIRTLLADNFDSHTLLTMLEDGVDGTKLIQLKIEAVEWLSRLKIQAANRSPEFCAMSLFDTMISSSSNPENTSLNREPSETPSFRQSRSIFDRMSLVRPMYSAEPTALTAFRSALLGRPASEANPQEMALRAAYLPGIYDAPWIQHLQSIRQYDFGSNFKPKQFREALLERLFTFTTMDLGEEESTDTANKILLLLQRRLQELLNTDDEEFSKDNLKLRSLLDNLHNELSDKPLSELLDDLELKEDPSIVDACARSIADFISKLSNALFEAERQHKFLNHQMRGGEGVSFGLTGSVDAYRAKTDDFLTIINTSSGVETSSIIGTIKNFFQLYIRPKQVQGKTFIQHISGGPLASITVLMQRSGPVEIAENMHRVYKDLSEKQLSTATKTLVHPYSFLRNILWLSTFHGQWLNEANPQYLEALKTPKDVVRKVYGNPPLIEQAIESVRQSGDMTKHAMPDVDTEHWNAIGDIWTNDSSTQLQRLRGVLHVPDMLAINYLRAKYPDSFSDYLTCNISDAELNAIYPPALWQTFFKKKAVNEQTVGNFIQGDSLADTAASDDPFASANPFAGSADAAENSRFAAAEDWLYALERWSERYKGGRNESMRDTTPEVQVRSSTRIEMSHPSPPPLVEKPETVPSEPSQQADVEDLELPPLDLPPIPHEPIDDDLDDSWGR